MSHKSKSSNIINNSSTSNNFSIDITNTYNGTVISEAHAAEIATWIDQENEKYIR